MQSDASLIEAHLGSFHSKKTLWISHFYIVLASYVSLLYDFTSEKNYYSLRYNIYRFRDEQTSSGYYSKGQG